MGEITDLQKRWAEAYTTTAAWNASEAARQVGVEPQCGQRWRRSEPVREYIEALQAEKSKSLAFTRDRLVYHLVAIATSDVTQILDYAEDGGVVITSPRDLPYHLRVAIKRIRWKPGGRRQDRYGTTYNAEPELVVEMHEKTTAFQILAGATGLNSVGPDGRPVLAAEQDERRVWTGGVTMKGPPPQGNGQGTEEDRKQLTLAAAAGSGRIDAPIDVEEIDEEGP